MSRVAGPSGYTLIELLVVLAVLGTLCAMAMPLAEVTVQRERERELRRALWEVRDALDAYRQARERGAIAAPADAPVYPPSLQALTQAMPDAREAHRGQTLRFLRSVPRDPFADPRLPAERTWGLRSYLSEADRPQAGADVYDIHSLSPRLGLNGVPLKEW